MVELNAGMGALAAAFSGVFLVVGLAFYVYYALALMTIARKTGVEPAWLAWIPIANLYLMWKISETPGWSWLLIIGGIIPFVGGVLLLAGMLWWWWKISERRGHAGWLAIGLAIPLVNVVVPGVIAWMDKPIGR